MSGTRSGEYTWGPSRSSQPRQNPQPRARGSNAAVAPSGPRNSRPAYAEYGVPSSGLNAAAPAFDPTAYSQNRSWNSVPASNAYNSTSLPFRPSTWRGGRSQAPLFASPAPVWGPPQAPRQPTHIRWTSGTSHDTKFEGPGSQHSAAAPYSNHNGRPESVGSLEKISRGRWTGSPPPPGAKAKLQAEDRTGRSGSPAVPESERIVSVPTPTAEYMQQSRLPSKLALKPRELLLVLDLNGTLLFRKKASRSSNFTPRDDMDAFVRFLLSKFTIMVWSSAKPGNVDLMCARIFNDEQRGKVVAEWARDKLGLTTWQYNQKVQVYKRLESVWASQAIFDSHPDAALGGRWDQSNTVLVDDSALKAVAQPHSILEIPEFSGTESKDAHTLRQVAAYLDQLRWQSDVSSFIRQTPFKIDTLWKDKEHIPGFS